jgi:structural maintenance of chromosome 4
MEYVTKEKELLEKQSMLCQLRRFECDSKAADEMKKKSKAEAKWKEEKERMNKLKAALNAKEDECKKEKEEFGRMTKEMGNAKAEWAVFERNNIQLEQDIKHLKEKRKTLAEEIKKNEKKAQEKLEDAEAASKEADECADELGELEAAAAEEERKLEVILESLKGETASLHDAMEEKQKEFMPFQKRLHAAQAEVDLAKSQRDLLAQRPTLVATRLAEAEKQLADVKGAVVEKKALLETTRTRQTEAQSRAKELERQVAQSREEEQKLAAEVRRLQSSIEHTRESAQAQTQRSVLLTRLMDAARSGTLKGIKGRLGDLGSIDPKFDVAISTAAPSLDHIVRSWPSLRLSGTKLAHVMAKPHSRWLRPLRQHPRPLLSSRRRCWARPASSCWRRSNTCVETWAPSTLPRAYLGCMIWSSPRSPSTPRRSTLLCATLSWPRTWSRYALYDLYPSHQQENAHALSHRRAGLPMELRDSRW